jgi:hypothetical protein
MADTDEVAGRARAAASLERPAGSGIRRDGARSSFRNAGSPRAQGFPVRTRPLRRHDRRVAAGRRGSRRADRSIRNAESLHTTCCRPDLSDRTPAQQDPLRRRGCQAPATPEHHRTAHRRLLTATESLHPFPRGTPAPRPSVSVERLRNGTLYAPLGNESFLERDPCSASVRDVPQAVSLHMRRIREDCRPDPESFGRAPARTRAGSTSIVGRQCSRMPSAG